MLDTRPSFAIATTVADTTENVLFFVQYHLAIGAERIFVFLDDNNTATYESLSCYARVEVFWHDSLLRASRKLVAISQDSAIYRNEDTEVMYRQCLNLGVASSYARLYGIDWLIHIDADELFYPNGVDISEFFDSLARREVSTCRFKNYECIPNQDPSQHHFFEIQKFKVNHYLFCGLEESQPNYSRSEDRLIAEISGKDSGYFNFYTNGKGATFLRQPFSIRGVHATAPSSGKIYSANEHEPLVLHYACATFDEYQRKYQTLGDFAEYWFSDPIHIESKRLFSGIDPTGKEARQYYNKYLALDPESVSRLEKAELVVDIDFASNVLRSLDAAALKEGAGLPRYLRKPHLAPTTQESPDELEIFFPDLAGLCARALAFDSSTRATRWIRRSSHRLGLAAAFTKTVDDRFVITIAGHPAVRIDSAEDQDAINDSVLALASRASSIRLSGAEFLCSADYDGMSRPDIAFAQARSILDLCSYIKYRRAQMQITLILPEIGESAIPLFESAYIDSILLLDKPLHATGAQARA
jgi:hypothetical protein